MTQWLSAVLGCVEARWTWPSRTNSLAPFPRRPSQSRTRRFTLGHYCAGSRRAARAWYVTGGIHHMSRGDAPFRGAADCASVECCQTRQFFFARASVRRFILRRRFGSGVAVLLRASFARLARGNLLLPSRAPHQVATAPRITCTGVVAADHGTLAAPHAPLAATRCTRHTAPYRTAPHCIAARGVHPARSTHPGTPVRAGCDSARHSAHAARGAVRAADGGCVQDAHCGIAKPPRAHARGVRGR